MKTKSVRQDSLNQLSGLKQKVHIDITTRSRGGIFIYFGVWMVTSVWADIVQLHPGLFYLNGTIFFSVAVMRGIHYFILTKNPGSNTLSMYRWLIALILFSALHWGVLTAWVIYGSEYQQLHYPYMVILPGFAIGGTAVLGISRIIGFFYPLLIFIPSFVMGFLIV